MDDFAFSNNENEQKPNDEDSFLDLEPSSEPERKSESESELHAEPEPNSEFEIKTEPEPSSIPEVSAESEPSLEPETKSEPEPSLDPETKSEPEPNLESETKSEPEAKAEPEPSSVPETSAEPEPSITPEVKTEPDSSSKSEVKTEPEPSSEPEVKAKPGLSSEPEIISDLESSAEPKIKAEPEPSSEPSMKTEPESSTKSGLNAESEPSSIPEIKAEPEASSEPEVKAESEPSPEPEPSVAPEIKAERKPEAKSEPEPNLEIKVNAESEPKSVPEASSEPKSSMTPEVIAESEPSFEPEVKVEPGVKADLVPSPEPEGISKPEPSSKPEGKSEPEPSSKSESNSVKTEPNSNPEPEPSAEPKSNTSPIEDLKSLSDVDVSSEFISAEQDVNQYKSTSTEKSIFNIDQSDREAKSHSDEIFNHEIKPEVTYSVSTESEFETKTEPVSEVSSKSKDHSFSLEDIVSIDSEESTTLRTINENWLTTTLSNIHGIPKLPSDLEVSEKENGAMKEEIKTQSPLITEQIVLKSENKSTDLISELHNNNPSEQVTERPEKSISDNVKDMLDMVTSSTINTTSTDQDGVSSSSFEFENIDKEHVTEFIDMQTTVMPSIIEHESIKEFPKTTIDSNSFEKVQSDDLSSLEKTSIPEPTKKLQSLTSLEEQITSLLPVNDMSTSTQSVIDNFNENSSNDEDSLDKIMPQPVSEQNIADVVNEDEQTSALDFQQKPELKKKEKKTSKNPDLYLSDTGFTKRNKTKIEKEYKKNNKSDNSEMMSEMSEILSMNKCEEGQFQCINGTTKDGSYCIQMSSRCNTNKDCTDNSDEYDCFEDGCSGNFQVIILYFVIFIILC